MPIFCASESAANSFAQASHTTEAHYSPPTLAERRTYRGISIDKNQQLGHEQTKIGLNGLRDLLA
jgi:hypothetical protein